MKRLFAVLRFLSLLLCIATIILWLRSYSGSDYISRNQPVKSELQFLASQRYALTFTRGSIRLSSEQYTYYPHNENIPASSSRKPAYWGYGRLGVGHLGWDYLDNDFSHWFNHLGFHIYETGHSASFYDAYEHIFAFPAALLATLFALPPLLLLRQLINHRRRQRANLCPHCGYDLRATPTKCPECGHTPL